ncbi:hypothetical protein [Hyphomicrobium sp.]|uniref:hypothetical protein n=1 Tax=Hyphomicrobium sp. TaxID=82 RepID=UPI001DAD0BD3|nr:hypothetical protein [Hyphomicrobium sp.]MBY0561476.1 hypothetical protein [Hyphomicrobium sp.]
MTMNFHAFVARICADGMTAARRDYKAPKDALKLKGALDGFERCLKANNPDDLGKLLDAATYQTHEARKSRDGNYWALRCAELEIEWVANVVSAALLNQGIAPIRSHLPTARAMEKAAEILGIKGSPVHG